MRFEEAFFHYAQIFWGQVTLLVSRWRNALNHSMFAKLSVLIWTGLGVWNAVFAHFKCIIFQINKSSGTRAYGVKANYGTTHYKVKKAIFLTSNFSTRQLCLNAEGYIAVNQIPAVPTYQSNERFKTHKINNDCQTLWVWQFTKQMHQVIQFSGYKEYNSLMQFHI